VWWIIGILLAYAFFVLFFKGAGGDPLPPKPNDKKKGAA
jgi:hypothetical protein